MAETRNTRKQDIDRLFQLCQKGKEDEFAACVESLRDVTGVLNSVTPGAVGFTFLHIACDRGLPKIVSVLVRKNVEINAQCLMGETPLLKAVRRHNVSCVTELSHKYEALDLRGLDVERSNIIEEAEKSGDARLELLIKLIAVCRAVQKLSHNSENLPDGRRPREELRRISRLFGAVRNCRRDLLNNQQASDVVAQDTITQDVLDRSVVLLRAVADIAYEKGQFYVMRKLMQARLEARHVKTMLDNWLPCRNHRRRQEHMLPEQERIVFCLLVVNLAKSGQHQLLFHLLGHLCGYSLAGEARPAHNCSKCLELWSALAEKRKNDIQGNLAVAFSQALESGQHTTAGHILWLMTEQSDCRLHLAWQELGLLSAIDKPLLDGLVFHKGIDVHSITIACNGTLKQLPSAVMYMNTLCLLDMSDTAIGPQLPADLFLLPYLQTVKAARCALESWPAISKVQPALTDLNLEGNRLTDVSSAFSSSQLSFLNLAKNALESITPVILSITSLTHLSVSDNPIEDLPVGLLRLVNLKSLNLTNTPLQSPLRTYRLDYNEIKQQLRAQVEQVQEESLKRVVIIGDSEQEQTDLIANLSAVSDLSRIVFINFGDMAAFTATKSMFHKGTSHYLVHITARGNLTDVAESTRIRNIIGQYRKSFSVEGPHGNDVGSILFVIMTDEDLAALPGDLRMGHPNQGGNRVFIISSGAQRNRHLRDLRRALSNLPASTMHAPKAHFAIRRVVREKRCRSELPLFMRVEDFKATVCLSAKSIAEDLIENVPNWLEGLHDFLLLTAEGAVLWHVHPTIPVTVCTDLSRLLCLLRKLAGVDQAHMPDSRPLEPVPDVVLSLLFAGLSSVVVTTANDVECLWVLAEQLGMAYRVNADEAFLPLLSDDLAAERVHHLATTTAAVHRVYELSLPLTTKAWLLFQAEFLALRDRLTPALVRSEGALTAGRHVNPHIWTNGVAFVCNAELVAMAQLNPPLNFSPQLPNVILLTITERLSEECLGMITDRLEHVCDDLRELIGDVSVQHMIPCSRCMSTNTREETTYCVAAVELLDQLLEESDPLVSLDCQHHGKEEVSRTQLADLLLLDFHRVFLPCTRDNLLQEATVEQVVSCEEEDTLDAGLPLPPTTRSTSEPSPHPGLSSLASSSIKIATGGQPLPAVPEQVTSSFASSIFSFSSSSSDEFYSASESSVSSSRSTSASPKSSPSAHVEVARPCSTLSDSLDGSNSHDPVPHTAKEEGRPAAAAPDEQNDLQQAVETLTAQENVEGCYANIYTNCTFNGDPVAVKVFKSDDLVKNSYITIKQLRREVAVLALVQFSMQFLSNIHPMLTSRRDAAMVMERGGKTLSALLQSTNQLSEPQTPRLAWHLMMLKVVQGLADLHSAGVVHRDVKPDNILVRGGQTQVQTGSCCLIDFHTAAQVRVARLHCHPGADDYKPPEISQERKAYRLPADIYSLGLLFLEVAAGRLLSQYPLAERIRLLRVDAQRNKQRLKALLIAADQCLSLAPADRPPAKEIVRFLSLPDCHFLVDSCNLDSSLSVPSLTAPPVQLGIGRASLVGTCCTEDSESPGNFLYSLQTVPLPPAEHRGECLKKKKGRIWSFCVNQSGLTFISRRKAIEVLGRLDCVKNEHAAKPISIPEPAWCMESFEDMVFAGLENGDIFLLQNIEEHGKMTVKRRPTITCSPDSSVQQILPVKCEGSLRLFCVSTKSRSQTELIVRCLTPSECGYDISQKLAQQVPSGSTGPRPLRQLFKSSVSSDVIWGVAGSKVYRWNTATLKISLQHDITRHLLGRQRFVEAEQCAEEVWRRVNGDRSRSLSRRPLPNDILSFCAINGVLWIGTRLGVIVLLEESATADDLCLLAVLEGHCRDVRQLLVIPSPMGSLPVESGKKAQNPQVISIGIHCSLECPSQGLGLRSSADVWRADGNTPACSDDMYTAIIWDAFSPQDVPDSFGPVVSDH